MTGDSAHPEPPPEEPAETDWSPQASRRVHMWLVDAGAVALLVLLGLLVAWRSLPTAACAVPPVAAPGGHLTARVVEDDGWADRYDPDGTGDCNYPSLPADGLHVAVSTEEYDDGAACGGYLDVRGPKGSVRVQVTDECGCPFSHMKLSYPAYSRIAGSGGEVQVWYQPVVDPPPAGPLAVVLSGGTGPERFEVQFLNQGNPLTSVEVRDTGGDWTGTRHEFSGYWTADGVGAGPYDIRLADVYGHRAVLTGIRLAPGAIQRTLVYLYGGGAAPRPRARPSAGTTGGPPSPTPTAFPSSTPTPAPSVTPSVPVTGAVPSGGPTARSRPEPDGCGD